MQIFVYEKQTTSLMLETWINIDIIQIAVNYYQENPTACFTHTESLGVNLKIKS